MWVKQMYVSVHPDAGWILHCVLCVLGCRLDNAVCVLVFTMQVRICSALLFWHVRYLETIPHQPCPFPSDAADAAL